jgi:hypothetical protein
MIRDPRRGSAIFLAAVAVILPACGGDEVQVASPSPSPTVSTPASPSPSPSPPAVCQTEPVTSLSATWQAYQAPSGTYSFLYPDGWENLTGQVTYEADELVTEETLAEAGVAPDEQIGATLVREPTGNINLTVIEIEGVVSSTDVVYGRQESRITGLPSVDQVLGTRLTGCAAGEGALGIDFLFTAPRADTGEEATFYQRSFFLVHEGTLYVLQILALDQATSEILDEVVRTWQWPGSTVGTESFAEAATTAEIDPAADAPDPATFASSFPSDAPTIYVVFQLQVGVGGEVQIVWTMGPELLAEDTLTLPDDGTWAYHAITPPPGGFTPGSYEVSLTLVSTAETRTVPFTVVQA